jgi:hypothetical protein
MTRRRFLIALLVIGLVCGAYQATVANRRPDADLNASGSATAPVDPDLEFTLFEEAHYQLWRKGLLPSPGSSDSPNFKFLIRMISDDIRCDSVWITGENHKDGLSLIHEGGQTIHEPEPVNSGKYSCINSCD